MRNSTGLLALPMSFKAVTIMDVLTVSNQIVPQWQEVSMMVFEWEITTKLPTKRWRDFERVGTYTRLLKCRHEWIHYHKKKTSWIQTVLFQTIIFEPRISHKACFGGHVNCTFWNNLNWFKIIFCVISRHTMHWESCKSFSK